MAGALLSAAGVIFLLFAVVGLQIALRFREVSVPNLVGQSVDQAATTLEPLGLQVRVEPLARIGPDYSRRPRRGPGSRPPG